LEWPNLHGKAKSHTNVKSVPSVSFECVILQNIKRGSMQEMTAINQQLMISEVVLQQKPHGKVK